MGVTNEGTESKREHSWGKQKEEGKKKEKEQKRER